MKIREEIAERRAAPPTARVLVSPLSPKDLLNDENDESEFVPIVHC